MKKTINFMKGTIEFMVGDLKQYMSPLGYFVLFCLLGLIGLASYGILRAVYGLVFQSEKFEHVVWGLIDYL